MVRKIQAPKHGFPIAEFEARHELARAAMTTAKLDALVVTAPQNVRYFTGFESQFWESPTRPWYVIVPRQGAVVAVFPSIGIPALLTTTWVKEHRFWSSPDLNDDGISLVAKTLTELPRKFGRIGWEFGREMLVRAPRIDVDAIGKAAGLEFADGSPVIWGLRMLKSDAEVARIREACRIGSDAVDLMSNSLRIGDSNRDSERKMRIALLECGADNVPFIATSSGQGGYAQIIAGPGDEKTRTGDVLFIDIGATYDGYFCDFDRNWACGPISDEARRVHDVLWLATEAGIKAARPGATMQDVFNVMSGTLTKAGSIGNNVGRIGHGLGMHLTEPPSFMAGDMTKLVPNMVVTIEPAMEYAPGRMLVHEEDIVIREGEPELLTRRAPREMPRID